MSLNFSGDYPELKNKLAKIGGAWDDSTSTKKTLRRDGAIMNWYETTGTIQFQGKLHLIPALEAEVKHLLYPSEYKQPEEPATITGVAEEVKMVEQPIATDIAEQYLNDEFEDSEIIIGLVSAVGTELSRVTGPLTDRLKGFGYEVFDIRLSSLLPAPTGNPSEYDRIKHLMDQGDHVRKSSGNHGILAYGASQLIKSKRPANGGKIVYIVNSLKHPDEVSALRKIYGHGFYLFGVHSDKKRRLNFLTNDKMLSQAQAAELISIDEDEKIKNGQKTRDTFHLSDFYLNVGKNEDQVKNTIQRFLELIFSHPYRNPTFDEFAMYMAFSSSVRSADLSRQVGAVISKNTQIIATGANEVPAAGGGHYWSKIEPESGEVIDVTDGKDYKRGEDSNKVEQNEIIKSLIDSLGSLNLEENLLESIGSKIRNSRINDLTEFGRVVHAEMQAILSCAKEGINCSSGTLYCTTFPCHNCAKHLIAAGIMRVVYVEPYAKSKALEFHSESIKTDDDDTERVLFEPFIGVGARRFLDFFSMGAGAGAKLKRKTGEGTIVEWSKETANVRVPVSPKSYLEIEISASGMFNKEINKG